MLKEQEEVRWEVWGLREVVKARVRASEGHERHVRDPRGEFDLEEDDEVERERRRREMYEDHDEDGDDDARSVRTVMGQETERVDEEDEPVDLEVDSGIIIRKPRPIIRVCLWVSSTTSTVPTPTPTSQMLTPEEREQQDEFERRE